MTLRYFNKLHRISDWEYENKCYRHPRLRSSLSSTSCHNGDWVNRDTNDRVITFRARLRMKSASGHDGSATSLKQMP